MPYFKNLTTGLIHYFDDEPGPEFQKLTDLEEQEHLSPASSPITPEKLKEIVTAYRWEVETGGLTLPSGVGVATGIDDQNRITSVVANAERSGLSEFDFKASSNWKRVTLFELQEIAVVIAQHVQACFSAERAHHEAIDALVLLYADDRDELQLALGDYDESQGWPDTDLREPQSA